jgi:hypothetical protein
VEQWIFPETFSLDKAVEAWEGLLRMDNADIVHSLPLYHTVFYLDVWAKDHSG